VYKDKKNAYWNSCKCVYWTTISHEYDVNKMMKEKKVKRAQIVLFLLHYR